MVIHGCNYNENDRSGTGVKEYASRVTSLACSPVDTGADSSGKCSSQCDKLLQVALSLQSKWLHCRQSDVIVSPQWDGRLVSSDMADNAASAKLTHEIDALGKRRFAVEWLSCFKLHSTELA